MSNIPGHIPGIHIPGTTVPIGAVAAASQARREPDVPVRAPRPPLSPEELKAFGDAIRDACDAANERLRQAVARLIGPENDGTSRPFVEFVRVEDTRVIRRPLRRTATISTNTRTEYVQRATGWVIPDLGLTLQDAGRAGSAHSRNIRLGISVDGQPTFVMFDGGRIRVGDFSFGDGSTLRTRSQALITSANWIATIARTLGLIPLSVADTALAAAYGSTATTIVHAIDRAPTCQPGWSDPQPLDAATGSGGPVAARSVPRALTPAQLSRVRELRHQVAARSEFLPGGRYGTGPRDQVQDRAARDVARLKARISRITGEPE